MRDSRCYSYVWAMTANRQQLVLIPILGFSGVVCHLTLPSPFGKIQEVDPWRSLSAPYFIKLQEFRVHKASIRLLQGI